MKVLDHHADHLGKCVHYGSTKFSEAVDELCEVYGLERQSARVYVADALADAWSTEDAEKES